MSLNTEVDYDNRVFSTIFSYVEKQKVDPSSEKHSKKQILAYRHALLNTVDESNSKIKYTSALATTSTKITN
jgi:hypothetical protein